MISKDTLFALSLFPYLGFLWFLTRSGKAPRLALIGFYFLLVFVFVTISAGVYAQEHYGRSLANVDWLHGGAEFFLSVSNILVILGFRQAVVSARRKQKQTTNNQQQTTNNKQPTTNNQQQTTNNQQPTTNNQQQITNNK